MSISEVMISFVEKRARRTAGISAHSAPPTQPATHIAAITIGPGQEPSAIPAAAAKIAPK